MECLTFGACCDPLRPVRYIPRDHMDKWQAGGGGLMGDLVGILLLLQKRSE